LPGCHIDRIAVHNTRVEYENIDVTHTELAEERGKHLETKITVMVL
jgi:hypothetical protein